MTRYSKAGPLTIGLTGGPGVGKSEAAKILGSYGAHIINADEIGHDILANNATVKRKLIKLFGKQVVNSDDELIRSAIGKIVFRDAQMMFDFNAIIHPVLLKVLKSRLKEIVAKKRYKLVVVDAALIFEWGIANWFDFILVVDARRDLRLTRISKNGLSKYQAGKRISSQIPQKMKKALADYVIINNSSKSVLKKQIDIIYNNLANQTPGRK